MVGRGDSGASVLSFLEGVLEGNLIIILSIGQDSKILVLSCMVFAFSNKNVNFVKFFF